MGLEIKYNQVIGYWMEIVNNKILITGAAGFIGSYLVSHLGINNDLIIVDSLEYGGDILNLPTRYQNHLIQKDSSTLNERDINMSNIDFCIHLAGISSLPENELDYSKAIHNNFVSTVNVYELCTRIGVKKFLFASTSAVYENNKSLPFKEDESVSPDLMYSYSKKLCEDYLQFRGQKNDSIETHILRFFNVFGPNQNTQRKNPPLTGYLLKCIENNERAILYNNNPDVKRDYIYVEDLLQSIDTILSSKERFHTNETWNITSGLSYSVYDIIQIMETIFKRKLQYEFKKPDNIWDKYPNISTKVNPERVAKEVFKSSSGSNGKLQQLLGNEYKFIDMAKGLKIMQEISSNKVNKFKGSDEFNA